MAIEKNLNNFIGQIIAIAAGKTSGVIWDQRHWSK
jgi:hypothetical protein